MGLVPGFWARTGTRPSYDDPGMVPLVSRQHKSKSYYGEIGGAINWRNIRGREGWLASATFKALRFGGAGASHPSLPL